MARTKVNELQEAWRHTNNIVSPFLSAKEDREEAEAYFHEPHLFIENFLHIPAKSVDAGLVPFKFKLGQRLVYDVIRKIEAKGKPVRIINLKNRRCGFSTLVSAFLYTKMRFSKNWEMRTLSIDNEAAEKIMAMYMRYHDLLPEEMRPLVARRKVGKLLAYGNVDPNTRYEFPGLNSLVQGGTSQKLTLGRGEGNRAIHLTESAYYPSMRETVRSILDTVPKTPHTYVFNETTSSGFGGDFYDAFTEARERLKTGDWDWYPIFLPCWLDEDCHPEITQEQKDMVLNTLDEWERDSIKKYSMVTENFLWWRRDKIAEKGGSIAAFNLEAAPSVDEAFAAQGQSVFPVNAIEFYFKNTIRPGRVGRLIVPEIREGEVGRPHFVDDSDGPLTLWEFPQKNMKYGIGADASMGQRGAEAEAAMMDDEYESDYDPDFCCAEVVSLQYHQVAELHIGMTDPESFAEEVAALGYFFNEGLVMPEVGCQGAGIGMMYRLRDVYHNLGMWEDLYSPHVKKKRAIGWEANPKTKSVLIGKAVRQVLHGAGIYQTQVNPEIYRQAKLVIRSQDLLGEMSTFAQLKNGSFGARQGKDDRVIAFCLALLALKDFARQGKPLPENTKKLSKEQGGNPFQHFQKQKRAAKSWLDL